MPPISEISRIPRSISFLLVTSTQLIQFPIGYEESCIRLFEAVEELEKSRLPAKEKPSAVQYVLNAMKK